MVVSLFKIPPLYLGFFYLSWRIVVDGCRLVLTALLEGSDAVGGCQKLNVIAALYCASLCLNGSIEVEFSIHLTCGRTVSVRICRESHHKWTEGDILATIGWCVRTRVLCRSTRMCLVLERSFT